MEFHTLKIMTVHDILEPNNINQTTKLIDYHLNLTRDLKIKFGIQWRMHDSLVV